MIAYIQGVDQTNVCAALLGKPIISGFISSYQNEDITILESIESCDILFESVDLIYLVLDIMSGLESKYDFIIDKINNKPCIVILNRIEKIYGWKSHTDKKLKTLLKHQSKSTLEIFINRSKEIKMQFAKKYLNADLYYEGKLDGSLLMVPFSSQTGDGIYDLLKLTEKIKWSKMPRNIFVDKVFTKNGISYQAIIRDMEHEPAIRKIGKTFVQLKFSTEKKYIKEKSLTGQLILNTNSWLSAQSIPNIRKIHIGQINKTLLIESIPTNLNPNRLDNKIQHVILNLGIKIPPGMEETATKLEIKIISGMTPKELIKNYEQYKNIIYTEIKHKYKYLQHDFQLEILPKYIFLKSNPIMIGVKVIEGRIELGMIIYANKKILGKITSIQKDNKSILFAKKADQVCIKIEPTDGKPTYDEDFNKSHTLTRYFIDKEITKIGRAHV